MRVKMIHDSLSFLSLISIRIDGDKHRLVMLNNVDEEAGGYPDLRTHPSLQMVFVRLNKHPGIQIKSEQVLF